MGELFTFFGLISHEKSFIYMTHMLLAAGIALVLVRMAMSNLKVVPTGAQNVMEAYISCFLRTRFCIQRSARLFLYEYFLYSLRQAIHCAYKV